MLPRSGREGLGKRANKGTVPDSAAVLIVLAPNASARNVPFNPKSVTAGCLGSPRSEYLGNL
jgi:hypothetical protein